jgi:hypothetical protein
VLTALALAATLAGVRVPDRLTAGAADQFLGTLSPDGRTLYFVSDEESTTQIYAQDLASGIPRLLFDELADTSWPRPSPDGKRLLYISYQTDAAGDLCVRELQGEKAGERRCLTGEGTSEMQAVWMPDGRGIAVVTRDGIHGNLELVRVALDGKRGDPVARQNLSSPALSPDGKFLVYVPVERGSSEIGPSFLSRAGGSIEIVALEGGGRRKGELDLPGASGFPAFSVDGKWLYFAQFLNDTNLDGAIDGSDNGVLFRAPFDAGALGPPEQLTSARWSCQYPLPAADRLVATCFQHGSLDVFSLPLDGGVPREWGAARLDDEISASRDRWDQLLLLARRGHEPQVLRRMIRLHLELGETESAAFYAARLARAEPQVGALLGELAAHRKAERSLSRGMLTSAFVGEARERLARLDRIKHPLSTLLKTEMLDTLGEEEQARAALQEIDTRDDLVAWLFAERLLALYRGHPRFFDLYRPLAERDLVHAQAFVRELMRGAAPAERARRAEEQQRKVDPDGDVAFLLELEKALAELTPDRQEPVRERVFQLYRKNKEFPRRKALVDATIARSVSADNEYLLYNFANTWASWVPREKAERPHAERLYRDAVIERAYVSAARGKIDDARGSFYGVTLQTESLEAHAGFIEMALLEKRDPRADYAKLPDGVPVRYAKAYLLARGLPAEQDPVKHEQTVTQAIALLSEIAKTAPQRAEVHHLWAYAAHQRWMRGGPRLAAVEANAHYLLALDLARESPRHRASVLDGVGRLQSSVGNHAIALGWLEERGKLPFAGDLPRLSHCLALARARFHTGDASGAAAGVDRCLEVPGGERYRALALDRSALYHLTAGDDEQAIARYAALWPLVEGQPAPEGPRNRLLARVGWGAAKLAAGDAAGALEQIGAAEKILAAGAPPPWEGPYRRYRPLAPATAADYDLLLAGLRAQAHFKAGQLAEAERAMTRRRDGLAARLSRTELDEDRLDLAGAEAQLGLYAHRLGRPERALERVEAALRQWDRWSESTNTPVEDTGLAILAAYAEVHIYGKLPLARLKLDLPGRVQAMVTRLNEVRNPLWEPMRERLALYLALLNLGRRS